MALAAQSVHIKEGWVRTMSKAAALEKQQVVRQPITLQDDSNIAGFLVNKSNKLVEGQTKLTARQQKVLAASIALINPKASYPNGITVELTDDQIEALTGIEKRVIFRFIDDAARAYHSIPIETPGKKKGTVDYINIALRSKYDPQERVFKITFHPEMESELLQLAEYTKYELRYLVDMDSKYSIRLYELLTKIYNKQKGGSQYWRVRLNSLYFPLGLTDINGKPLTKSYINTFAAFRRRVLEPACEEITSKTDLSVTYSSYRAGRTIGGVIFSIERKDRSLKDVPKIGGEEPNPQDAMREMGIADNVADTLAARYSKDVIESNVAYLKERLRLGRKVDNVTSYLNYLLKHNIAGLPDVANPYSAKYANNKAGCEFVKRLVLPIWWKLDEGLRETLETKGATFATHLVTSEDYETFVAVVKNQGVEEAELLFDTDELKDKWEADYKDKSSRHAL